MARPERIVDVLQDGRFDAPPLQHGDGCRVGHSALHLIGTEPLRATPRRKEQRGTGAISDRLQT